MSLTLNVISQSYARIIDRIYNSANDRLQNHHVKKILGLIACASTTRPLRWHEIQGAFAIGNDQTIDFEYRSLRGDIKDLCGSLVEVRSNGAIEFVHKTAYQ